MNTATILDMMFNAERIVKDMKGGKEDMIEKRFTVPIKYRFSHSKIQLNGEPLTNDELVRILNTNDGAFVENFALKKENEQLKKELRLKEEEERINCRNCSYFISNPSSDCCLKREDIGYKGTCIDGMDYYYLAKNCPYY